MYGTMQMSPSRVYNGLRTIAVVHISYGNDFVNRLSPVTNMFMKMANAFGTNYIQTCANDVEAEDI